MTWAIPVREYFGKCYCSLFNSLMFLILQAVAPYLPVGDPPLSPAIYEMVLHTFLLTDTKVRKLQSL